MISMKIVCAGLYFVGTHLGDNCIQNFNLGGISSDIRLEI